MKRYSLHLKVLGDGMKLGAVLFLCLLLSNCTRKSSGDFGYLDTSSTQKVSITALPSSDAFGTPNKKVFRLRTCFVHADSTSPIRDEEPIKISTDNKTFLRDTDPQGCAEWEQFIEFNFFAPENPIEKKVTFENNIGKKTAAFVFNPWADTFLDLRTETTAHYVPSQESVAALKGIEKFHPRNFIVDDTNLSTTKVEGTYLDGNHTEKEMQLSWEVSLNLQGQRKSLGPAYEPVAITKGKFQTHWALLECSAYECETKGSSKVLTWNMLSAGKLQGQVALALEKGIRDPGNNQLFIAYQITPQGPENELLPAQGKCQLKKIKDGFSCSGPSVVSLNQNIFDSRFNAENRKEPLFQMGFEIYKWEVTESRSLAYDPEHLTKQREFNIKACIRNSFTGAAPANKTFYVSLSQNFADHDRHRQIRTVDDIQEGCLYWTQTLPFPVYETQRNYIPFNVTVEGAETPYQNIRHTRSVALYPYGKTTKVLDAQNVVTPILTTTQGNKIGIDLDSKQFFYYTGDQDVRSVKMDSLFQLRHIFPFHLKFRALLSETNPLDQLQPGPLEKETRLKIRGLLLDADDDTTQWDRNKDYLTHFETETTVLENGWVDTQVKIPLDFVDAARYAHKLKLVLEISLVGQPEMKLLNAGDFNIEMNNSSKLGHVTPLESVYETYLPTSVATDRVAVNSKACYFEKQRAVASQKGIRLFQDYWKTYTDLEFSETLKPEVDTSKLCAGDKECAEKFSEFFSIDRFQVIDDETHPIVVKSDTKKSTLVVTKQHFSEFNESDKIIRADRSVHEFIPLQVSGRLAHDRFGLNAGVGSSYSYKKEQYKLLEAAYTIDHRDRKSISETITLLEEKTIVEFQAEVRQCIFAKPFSTIAAIRPQLKSWLVCTPKQKGQFKEVFYRIEDQTQPHGTSNNPSSPNFHSWTKLIRGEKDHAAFMEKLKEATNNFEFQKIESAKDGVDKVLEGTFDKRFFVEGGTFPSLFNYESSTKYLWTEAQILAWTDSCFEGQKTKASQLNVILNSEKAYKKCRCYFENLSRRARYADFLEKDTFEKWKKALVNDNTVARCEEYAISR